jgi:hypothetical protein
MLEGVAHKMGPCTRLESFRNFFGGCFVIDQKSDIAWVDKALKDVHLGFGM